MPDIKVNARVWSVDIFDFTSDQGEIIRGCKVITLDSSPNPNGIGNQIIKYSAPHEFHKKFSQIPGNYEITLSMTSGKKVGLRCIDARFLSPENK